MKYFKQIFDFYLNASIHVALAVVAFTEITVWQLNLNRDLYLYAFLFTATITAYNFVKFSGIAKFQFRGLNKRLQQIQIFSFAVIPLMLCFLFQLNLGLFFLILGLGALTFLYAVPLSPKSKNLRNMSGLKVFIIALVWTGATVFLPLLSNGFEFSNIELQDICYALLRFLLVLVLIIPFEIRDLGWDDAELKTIPQLFGESKAKIIGSILILLAILIEVYFEFYTHPAELALRYALLLFLLRYSGRQRSRYYTIFWVEALPLFWLILLKVLTTL